MAGSSLGPVLDAPAAFRVMTFNIHHGVGTDGVLDLGRIASVVRDAGPDLVGLQEVDRHFGTRSARADQASWLGRATGMRSWFGPSISIGGSEYGNAALTVIPALSRDWAALPTAPGAEPRSVLRCRLAGGLQLWVTHLTNDDPVARVEQARAIVARLHDRSGPTIVLGDLNATPDDPCLKEFGTALVDPWTARGEGEGATFSSTHPRLRIDYVLTTPDIVASRIEVVDVGVASDHHAVVADLRIGP